MQQNNEEKTTEKLMLHPQHCWPLWSAKENWQTPHRLFCNPERQEKLEDNVKRMPIPRTLVWPSNGKLLSDTTAPPPNPQTEQQNPKV